MSEVAARGWTWFRTNTAKKTLILIVVALLIVNLNLIGTGDSFQYTVGFWPTKGDASRPSTDGPGIDGPGNDGPGIYVPPTPPPQPPANPLQPPTTPLLNSEFGLRGNRVEQLAAWADQLLNGTSQDLEAFEASLVAQFPFLSGALNSIYTPWSPKHNGAPDLPEQPSFVISAGVKNLNMASHLVRTLRRVHGSDVPIEIAYGGEEDIGPDHRRFLDELEPGVEFTDLTQRFPAAWQDLRKAGWAMKPFALLAAQSPRALLLDADALFLTSPDALFDEHAELNRTGTLFFHDRAMKRGDASRREFVQAQLDAAGRRPSPYLANDSLFWKGESWWEQESGVVAVDRSNPRVMLGLIFAAWMNTKEVREEVTYKTFHGDKETFWLAMELSGFEYYFQPWYAGNIGTVAKGQSEKDLANVNATVCGKHLLHLDHLGAPLWINGGIYANKDHPEKGHAALTHWLVDEVDGERSHWYTGTGRTCFKGLGVKPLPEEIKKTLKKMRDEATIVDMMIKQLPKVEADV